MASNAMYTQLADAAYNPTSTTLPSGWTLIRQADPNNAGYSGAAFGNPGSGLAKMHAHPHTSPSSPNNSYPAAM
jgi:hypothetical protein